MLLWMMRPPSEYIAPFDEDRQTGLVQTVPAGGVVAVCVGVGVAVAVGVRVGVGVGVRVGVAVVAVGDADGLDDAVAD